MWREKYQQYRLASMASWLSSTGISHHDLLPHIPSVCLSTVNSSPRTGIGPQSLNTSSQPLPLPGNLHSYPAYVWLCSVQFSSLAQWCPTLCDPMNCSTPGLPVHHQLLEFTQTQVHRVSDTIQLSHPLSSPSPPAPNPSQHQSFPMSQLFA